MKRNEILVYDLCEEIDDLKQMVQYWKDKYESEVLERNMEYNERMETAKNGISQALMFALSVKDMPDGSLTITKEDRKNLAYQFKH